MAWFVFNGEAHDLSEETTLGRSPSCSIVVRDGLASRKHATVLLRGANYLIQDNHSHNGLRVNGKLVHGAKVLNDADRVMIGTCEFEFRVKEDTPTGVFSVLPQPKTRNSILDMSEVDFSTVTATSAGMSILGGVFTRALAEGRLADAHRIAKALSAKLAKSVENGSVERGELGACADLVLRYADAAQDVRWIEWLLRIFAAAKAFPAPHTVEEIYELSKKLGLNDPDAPATWVGALRHRAKSATEKAAIARITALITFASDTQA